MLLADPLEQLRVPAGVEAVEPAGEDGEGRAVLGGECPAVRRGVDAEGPAWHRGAAAAADAGEAGTDEADAGDAAESSAALVAVSASAPSALSDGWKRTELLSARCCGVSEPLEAS